MDLRFVRNYLLISVLIVLNSLLIVAYPNGDTVMSSIRQADDYSNPHLANGTDATLNPIAQGTFVNSTGWTFTFLCSNCITTDGRTFFSNATNPYLGWTQSTTALQNPSDPDAVLNFHDYFGSWGVNLTAAQSPDFASWASMASATNSTSTSTSKKPRSIRRGLHAF
jgi:cellobiose dehydrogenase (acceptor)